MSTNEFWSKVNKYKKQNTGASSARGTSTATEAFWSKVQKYQDEEGEKFDRLLSSNKRVFEAPVKEETAIKADTSKGTSVFDYKNNKDWTSVVIGGKEVSTVPTRELSKKEKALAEFDFWTAPIAAGGSSLAGSFSSTLDAVIGRPLQKAGWENNPISALNQGIKADLENARKHREEAAKTLGRTGKGWGVAAEVTEGVVAAVPEALVSLATMGMGSATTATLADDALRATGTMLQRIGLTTSNMLKNPQYWTSFVREYGGEFEDAIDSGASEEVAALTATIKSLFNAGIEIGTDGGSGFQGLSDDIAKGGKKLLDWVESSLEEGLEEVVQGFISRLVSKVGYDPEVKVLDAKTSAQEFGMGTAVGAILGGGQAVATNAIVNADAKKQAETKEKFLTENEQKVVEAEVAKRIAKKSDGGENVTKKGAAKIEKQVRSDLKKGYISTDLIEEVLGGESYKAYKDTLDNEANLKKKVDELIKESDRLENIPTNQLTGREQQRRDRLRDLIPELQNQIRVNENSTTKKDLKKKLENEVIKMTLGDRLSESYAEKARAYQKLDIDPETFSKAKHAEAAKQTVASAVELGANNTNRVRDLVEHAAQISGKTGKAFFFKDNDTIKNSFIERQTKAIEKLEQIENRDAKQNKLLDAMKQKLEDVKSGKIIVNGENSADGIVLNIDSKNPLMVTVGHEVTHDTENVKHYDKMKKALFAYAKTKGVDVETRIAMAKAEYEGIADADAEHEVVADLAGEMLFTDDAFVEHLARTDTNVFQSLWNDIKNLVKMATPGSKEAKELANLEHKFEKAFREANKAQKNTTEDGGAKYKISDLEIERVNIPYGDTETENQAVDVKVSDLVDRGKVVPLSDDSITKYKESTDWEKYKEVRQLLRDVLKPNMGVSVVFEHGNQGAVAYLTSTGIDHAVGGPASPRKAAAFEKFSSLVKNAEYVFSSENDGHSKSEKNIEGDILWDTFVAVGTIDGDPYPVTFKIRSIDSDVRSQIYEMATKNETGFSREDGTQENPANAHSSYGTSPISGENVAQEEPVVKKQFSLSSAVEKTKNLVALHNLTEDKLFKSLELGGLPMPSIAITKSDIPHSNFGEITLIFGRETIDPKVNKKNKTYSADAWTPVFPRVEYEENSEVANKVSRKLHGLYNKVDDTFRRELGLVSSGFEHYLNRNGGEEGLIERVKDNYGLKAAFLEEQGKHIDKVTTTKEVEKGYNPANADKYQKVADILGVTTKDEIGKLPFKAVTDAQKAELEKIYPGISSTAYRMSRIFGMVGAYLDGQNSETKYETVTDYEATNKAVDDALDVEAYDAWVRNLFAGIEKSKGIYNNKDIFTPSGNRRTFAQTHLPVTLENIVKAMATQNGGNTKNVSGFNGIKTLRAATAETFKSVDEMHKREGRLQNLSEAQLGEIQNELQTRLYNIIDTIDKESGRSGYDNEFMRFDTIGNILTEIGESGKYNVADIQKVLKEYGRDVSDDTAMQVKQLLYDVTQMPVNIFEAKPARVVGFDEAKVFVIPNNADPKLKQELLNRGYSIAEYDPDVEGNRQKVVNQFEEYRFSLSDANAQPTAKGITGKDFRVKTESVAPTYDVMGATPAVEVPAQTPIAPVETPAPVVNVADAPADLLADIEYRVRSKHSDIYGYKFWIGSGKAGSFRHYKVTAPDGTVFDGVSKNPEATVAETIAKEYGNATPITAPVAEDDIAPVADPVEREEYEAIRPQRPARQVDEDIAPVRGEKMVRLDSNNGRPGEKQRKWVGTSTDSEVVDGKVLPEDLDQDLIHYQPISNKKTLGNANAMLESKGYDSSVSYMKQRFAAQKVSLDDIALGERLIQEAVKKGDIATAQELIMDISILGTELGQKVQALSIIKRLTPEGQLKMLMKTVERGKAKGDKAFKNVEVTKEDAEKILKTRKKDGSYDQAELNKAVEEVKQDIANKMSASVLEIANEWRYLSMLGNPKTHIRNLVSNVAMLGTRKVKNVVARTFETFAGNSIKRTKTFVPASKAVRNYAKQVTDEMYAGAKDTKYSEATSIKSKRKILGPINALSKANSALLSWEDTIFSKPAFRESFREYLTANGIKTEADIEENSKLISEAKMYAMRQAQEATFQQDSYIASKIAEIERKNPLFNVAIGAVLPFKKTPINVAKTGAAYSPLGLARNLYDTVKVAKGEMEVSEAIDHFAQTLTGTSLALLGYYLASVGLLNGAGEDDKEAKYDYQLGKQSYSLSFDGDTFSLSWLSPVAMPLFVGANAFEQLVEEKDWDYNVLAEALAQTLDPLNEMSFLSSLSDVLSSYESGMAAFGGMIETAAQSYITSFVPTLSSQVAQVMDDKKRSTKIGADSNQDFLDETWNKIKYKIPGLRETLEVSTDIWGREIKQTDDMVERALETFIAPYSRKDDISTRVDEEIKNIYRLTGENGVIPNVPNNYVTYKNEKYEMSAEDFTKYKKEYGQTAYNLMSQLIATDTYQKASATDKAKMMDEVFTYAQDEAKRKYLAKQGVEYNNSTKDNVPYYKENAIKGAIENDMTLDEYKYFRENPEGYALAKSVGGYEAYTEYSDALNELKADKDAWGQSISGSRKAKVQQYIANMDADPMTKIILYKSQYTSFDDYNYQILEYLDSRDDLSWEEMKNILIKLDFKVSDDGRVTW